jgi:RNA polymerase sigma factor (sigma-70 family)
MAQPQDTSYLAINQALLFDRYGSLIFAYIRGHTLSREDAEDLTLEVFLAALESDNINAFSELEQLLWLKKVARNKLADYYRKAQRRPSVRLDTLTEFLLDEIASPEEIALQEERHGELRAYVQQLSPFQQQLLQLRYGQGLHCNEIATLLHQSDDSIRQQLSRTIRHLRALYQHQSAAKGELL